MIFLLLTALGIADAQPASADALVSKIQKFYDSTKDLHAKFDQQLESGIGGKKKASGDVAPWLPAALALGSPAPPIVQNSAEPGTRAYGIASRILARPQV